MTHLARPSAVLLGSFFLLACGGGGGSDVGPDAGPSTDGSVPTDGGSPDAGGEPDAGEDSGRPPIACDGPADCAEAFEAAAEEELEALRGNAGPLRRFLVDMPKGGDLHNHLSGAIYAESYLRWAELAGSYCIDLASLGLSNSCSTAGREPLPAEEEARYGEVVQAWSMLDFVPSATETGRDHFFATFGKFGLISGREHGRMVADVRRQAAEENLLYVETMLTSNSTARNLGEDLWGELHGGQTLDRAAMAGFHAELLADARFGAARARQLSDAQDSEAEADAEQGCATATPQPACDVTTRYQAYISRSGSRAGVFAQMVAAYEAAKLDPRVVALNLVGPEDSSAALSAYAIQMTMLQYLEAYYEGTSPLRLSLHAGELTPAFTTRNLAVENHIREAVVTAGAERVGHGIDLEWESDPEGLLALLREREVLVEICLASNDHILEVTGPTHPIHDYLAAGVPVALATDDPGVARSSIAGEHVRAVVDQDLDYRTLKQMARASLEHSFLQGESLWADGSFGSLGAACAPTEGQTLASEEPSAACLALLEASPRARVQRELELRYLAFEAGR